MAVAPPLSTHVSRTLTSNLHLWPRTHGGVAHARTRALIPTPAAACAFRFSFRVRATASGSKLPPYPLPDVFPYITAEWEAVAKGWACAAVAVYCLSRAVPAAGRLPRALAGGGGGGGAAVVVAARGGVALAAFASARAAATYAQQAFLWEAALQAAGRLRERAFERLLERDLEFFEGRGGVAAGDIAHRITDEADDVADALFSVLNVLPSMLTVKANNGELKEIMRFQKLARADLKNNLSKKKMKALIPQAVRATYIGGLLVLCAGSIVVSGSSFDAEEFLSFLTALALVVEPIQDAGKAYNEYKQGQPALERIFDLMRFNPKVTDKPRAIHLQSINGDIKFHDVTFRYVDDMPPVADGVNLHIRPGEIIALVGPSGGGKTTLAKLLLRLYHPQKGYILLDNHDIQDIQSQCLRTHIAFVSQDTMLFSGTIAENIAYRDPVGDIDMNRVEYAAKIANAEEFIKMLPEGYNSNVGQRGSSLSGGQKQRLSIARAIYQNSSILIMDEATSALDIRSELLLKEALSNLIAKHSVTVIIIAHRQEMVLMADRIISLERGELREMSKQAFLSQDGHFSLPRIRSPN
ncbi:ABC transporter B family member 29, chloroplastic isoform X3 [Zea mays]|uniref:ABC transporter B family member 29, chloroplastic n=1 Tax=Zea mays TaxID=4577 RepID=A0A804MGH8_MAIZE|nr:ABC transporter B family member 29, chloroplastic isoform X3 [Zea mays]|eukprot:XP_008669448.1 ABC transporter B family member 29, chloroplastic isoform X3 [Zea mays]